MPHLGSRQRCAIPVAASRCRSHRDPECHTPAPVSSDVRRRDRPGGGEGGGTVGDAAELAGLDPGERHADREPGQRQGGCDGAVHDQARWSWMRSSQRPRRRARLCNQLPDVSTRPSAGSTVNGFPVPDLNLRPQSAPRNVDVRSAATRHRIKRAKSHYRVLYLELPAGVRTARRAWHSWQCAYDDAGKEQSGDRCAERRLDRTERRTVNVATLSVTLGVP